MKKIFTIMAMMLVAASVSAQTDMNAVFNKGKETIKLEKNKLEAQFRMKQVSARLNHIDALVEKFANSLRRGGIDVTAFTDEDIDRLDSIRKTQVDYDFNDFHYAVDFNSYGLPNLCDMPSDDFKRAMQKEKEYYLTYKCYAGIAHTYGVKPNSTVVVGRKAFSEINGETKSLYDGDILKVGSVTIICFKEWDKYWPIDVTEKLKERKMSITEMRRWLKSESKAETDKFNKALKSMRKKASKKRKEELNNILSVRG